MNKIVLIAVLLAVISVLAIAQQCPENCSDHGVCNGGHCSCDAGYGGSDCSIVDNEISSGQTVSGHVGTFRWVYYHISVSQGTSALVIDVNETSVFGDVDVFVDWGSYPNSVDYYIKDTSTSRDVTLTVDNPRSSTWYIGLYGYWESDYDITVTLQTGCTVDCVHGDCIGETCECDDPYVNTPTAQDCSTFDKQLSSGHSSHDTVGDRVWNYYHIHADSHSTLLIEVQQDSDGSDVDLYVNTDTYPDLFTWVAFNATTNPNTILYFADTNNAEYYLGIYGYIGGSYTITATTGEAQQSCPNDCSGTAHGTCSASTGDCSCSSDYSGDACDTTRHGIAYGTWYDGYVATGSWNYWRLDTSTANNVIVNVTQVGANANGDCDMYIKQDGKPTRMDYQYADLSYNQDYFLVIQQAGFETWWIGIYGWNTCSYQIQTNIISNCTCVPGLSHGACTMGNDFCVCDEGWGGIGCTEQMIQLNSGDVVQGSTTQNQWVYYSITTDDHALVVTMKESNTTGFLYLAVSTHGAPTLDNYEWEDFETNTNFHEIHIANLYAEPGVYTTYYIGVYGNAFDNFNGPVEYALTAWTTPF